MHKICASYAVHAYMVSTSVVCRGHDRLSYDMHEGVDKGVQTDNIFEGLQTCLSSDTHCYLSEIPYQPLHACYMIVCDDPCTPQLC